MNELEIKQPLQKLQKYINKGVGSLMMPKDVKQIINEQAQEIQMIGEADAYDVSLPVELFDENRETILANELTQRTYSRLLYQETKKQTNIESILHNAYNELESEENVSEKEIDEDWINRFFNSIEDIGNIDMQILWGKILAGEIKFPNSFSLRTLDKVKSLSQYEAITFTKLCSFVVNIQGNLGILNNHELLTKHMINYSDILKMDECGLIDSSAMISISFNIDAERIIVYGNKLAKLVDNRPEAGKKLDCQIYKLTESGAELFKILQITYNYVFFTNVLNEIIKGKDYLKYTVHNINYINANGTVNYMLEPCEPITEIVN